MFMNALSEEGEVTALFLAASPGFCVNDLVSESLQLQPVLSVQRALSCCLFSHYSVMVI